MSSTLVALGATLTAAPVLPWWPLRIAASTLGGLLLVRAFILYHDFMHRALLRHSRLAMAGFYFFGMLLLTPPRYWRYSHNSHHAHVGKPVGPEGGPVFLVSSDIGSFPLMSTGAWRDASLWQRLRYRVSRHPLTLLSAYLTVFLINLCLVPLVRSPQKYWDGALSVFAHGMLLTVIWVAADISALF